MQKRRIFAERADESQAASLVLLVPNSKIPGWALYVWNDPSSELL